MLYQGSVNSKQRFKCIYTLSDDTGDIYLICTHVSSTALVVCSHLEPQVLLVIVTEDVNKNVQTGRADADVWICLFGCKLAH